MSRSGRVFFLGLSAVLLILSHPFAIGDRAFLDGGGLAWVALVPWWLVIRNDPPRAAFEATFWMATLYFTGLLYWLVVALHVFGGIGLPTSIAALFLLAFWLALFPAAAAGVGRRAGFPLALPICWAAAEWARGALLTGFPWGDLGTTQWRFPLVAQLAEGTGTPGVAAMLVLVNVTLAETLVHWKARGIRGLRPALLVPLALVLCAWRMKAIDRETAALPVIQVALAQSNIAQDQKHDRFFDALARQRYRTELHAAEAAGVDLEVWPEAAIPSAVHIRSERLPEEEMPVANAVWLLAGAATWWDEGETRLAHNSALLVAPGGAVAGRYDKSHLVPFGEYVPLSPVLFFLRRLTQGSGSFLPGDSHRPLAFPKARLGVLICYEDLFPEAAREEVREGSELLVTLTNDAWYGHTSAPWQHAAVDVFRSIESRRAMVRAAQTGVSQAVDPAGRITDSLGSFVGPRSLVVSVPVGGTRSLYSVFGAWFAAGCLGMACALSRSPPAP